MAILENSILQGGRGRIGDLVIYQSLGKTIVRGKPNCVSMVYSPEVLAQRERMASVAMLYRAMKAVNLYEIWRIAAKGTGLTGYNLFVKQNVSVFTGEGVISDFQKLCLTTGSLQLPDKMRIGRGDDGAWIIEWENNAPYSGTDDEDRLVVALMKREDIFTIKIPDIGDYRRKHCRVVIRLPTSLEDYKHLYCYFCSAAGQRFSESRYFY